MKIKNIVFLSLFFLGSLTAFSQRGNESKMYDIFLEYLQNRMVLTPQESIRMRPPVIQYFETVKQINRRFATDPLEKEQQRIAVKLKYRDIFTKIIGFQRATQFFTEEQIFRKKVRDALKEKRAVAS